jgi:hypothetical protein
MTLWPVSSEAAEIFLEFKRDIPFQESRPNQAVRLKATE